MFRRLVVSAALVLSSVVPFASAVAQPSSVIPGLHLKFTTPMGTAYQTSPIDVFVTLMLDAGAPAFNFDGRSYDPTSPMPFGIPKSTLPTEGFEFGTDELATFAPDSYNSAFLFLVPNCEASTFLPACPSQFGPPYDFTFGVGLGLDGSTFSIAPGTSMDFLLGTLTPTGGIAPVGTYTLADAQIIAQVNGKDDAGRDIAGFTTGLVDACDNVVPSCGFSRDVIPTPEPATFGLLTLGLGFVGVVRRRRTV
jgi:PEP-CTERM motif-containing protein